MLRALKNQNTVAAMRHSVTAFQLVLSKRKILTMPFRIFTAVLYTNFRKILWKALLKKNKPPGLISPEVF